MISKAFDLAIKKALKNKKLFLINISSLIIGMSACIIIFLWARNEMSFDKFHNGSDKLYRINCINVRENEKVRLANSWGPLGKDMVQYFPEVISSSCLFKSRDQAIVEVSDHVFFEKDFLYADSAFFDLFSFKVLFGDLKTMLVNQNSIVLTRSLAIKYFNNSDVVGKIIKINNTEIYTVTGIIDDLPGNTHFKFTALISLCSLNNRDINMYGGLLYYNYIKIDKNASIKSIESKIKEFQLTLMDEYRSRMTEIAFQPVEDIHLNSHLIGEIATNGRMYFVYFFAIIGFVILIVTSINFTILFMAQVNKLASTLGIYRIAGANKFQLVFYIWVDILIYSIIALCFSIIVLGIIKPYVNQLLGNQLLINFFNLEFSSIALGTMLLISLTSLIYPILFVFNFNPVKEIRGISHKSILFNSRNILIIIQFLVAISLISSTIIVFNQLKYIYKKDIGFDKNNILCVRIKKEDIQNKIGLIKSELESFPNIISVAASGGVLGKTVSISAFWDVEKPQDADPMLEKYDRIDSDYIPTLNLSLIEGRNFSKTNKKDNRSIIVNEKFVKEVGWENAIGKKIFFDGAFLEVIGVIQDFNNVSLHNNPEPFLFVPLEFGGLRYLNIKFQGASFEELKNEVQNTLSSLGITSHLEFFLLSDTFEQFYYSEHIMGIILLIFTFLIITLSILGILGISQYMCEKKTKEIAIRKVLGEPIFDIFILLNKKFIYWVCIASVLSCPIVYYYLSKWLDKFVYHKVLNGWPFVISVLVTLLIVISSVSIHAYKYATINPVKGIRLE